MLCELIHVSGDVFVLRAGIHFVVLRVLESCFPALRFRCSVFEMPNTRSVGTEQQQQQSQMHLEALRLLENA